MPTAFDRGEMLRRLADQPHDLLVVGGGITGVGVALDAASRGLRTALVERDDFASGTSSKSSKLIHGGLRYLQQGEVALVYEALAERQRLRRNAPHLVRVLPFMLTSYSNPPIFDVPPGRIRFCTLIALTTSVGDSDLAWSAAGSRSTWICGCLPP